MKTGSRLKMNRVRKSEMSRRDPRRIQMLMSDDFSQEVEQNDGQEEALGNAGSDDNTDADENDSDDNNTNEELRTADDLHWPLDMLQEQFRILQSRIVDEVRRAIREEFDDMRLAVS